MPGLDRIQPGDGFAELTGGPPPARRPRAATGEAGRRTAERLWALADELTRARFAAVSA